MDSARTLVYPSGGLLSKEKSPLLSNSMEKNTTATLTPPQFCDFWALQPDLLSEGDTIRVFDVNGVQCGDTLVNVQGGFLVHVSGDDLSTLNIDEGAITGEEVYFTINGDSSTVIGSSLNSDTTIILSQSPTWEYMGSKRVQLAMHTGFRMNSGTIPIPTEATLLHNYPNPFNAQTVISLQIHRASRVTVHIFDSKGRRVRRLITNGHRNPGQYRIRWDGRSDEGIRVSSGVYVCQLQVGTNRSSIKMVLLY